MDTPDVVAVGRAAARLSDWQTITYFLMVLIVLLIVERYFYAISIRRERRDMGRERERMWQVSEKFGEAADKLGDEVNKVATELEVQRALGARLEGVVTALESRVAALDRRQP